MGTLGTLRSATTLTPTSGSDQSDTWISLCSSETRQLGLSLSDSVSPHKTPGRTLFVLVIHGHAHRRGPRSHSHDHWLVALVRIHGLHSTTDLILQRRCLSYHDPETLVPTSLRISSSTKTTKSPICKCSDSGPVRLTEQHHFSDRRTKPLSDQPSTSP